MRRHAPGTSSATLPVHLSCYEVGDKDGFVEIFAHRVDMDGSHTERVFTATVENFGEEGTLVRGTFSGTIVDADGTLHEITDGRFAIHRTTAGDRRAGRRPRCTVSCRAAS